MREIKFRARHIKNKQWYFGVERDDEADPLLPLGIFWLWVENGILDRETLGQYTGLKDKSGVEIYGGDIVEYDPIGWKDSFSRWQIKFNLGEFHLWGERPSLIDRESPDTACVAIGAAHSHCSIIGNIYENPELLKEKIS